MKRSCLIGLVGLWLVGCATTRNYERRLDEWVGRDSRDLVAAWGEPARIHTYGDGRKAYEYRFVDKHMKRAPAREHSASSHAPTGCVTYFFINASTEAVLSWKWEGHECTSK